MTKTVKKNFYHKQTRYPPFYSFFLKLSRDQQMLLIFKYIILTIKCQTLLQVNDLIESNFFAKFRKS